jgi:hypothetical protein
MAEIVRQAVRLEEMRLLKATLSKFLSSPDMFAPLASSTGFKKSTMS